jgi:hypothetical protein
LFQVTTKSRGALVICNISDRYPCGNQAKPRIESRSGQTSSADEFLDAVLTWFGDPDPRLGTAWEKAKDWRSSSHTAEPYWFWMAWSRSKILLAREKDGYVNLPSRPFCASREDAPPIILTHGWSANSTEWDYLKKELADDFRLIVWDLPGLGLSKQS